MVRPLPNITYKSKFPEIRGIEIIRLESIANRKDKLLDHHPEKPHQIDFYKLIFFSSGETGHLVDLKTYHNVFKICAEILS